MKTTENISIAGYAFTIETEAYEALSAYLDEIRRSFEGNASADEITSDIEERIAELLLEKCKASVVVNIRMVDEIRKRIGEPEALTGTEQEKKTEKETRMHRVKRLYRNMEGKVLGGVCSGLGIYFGIDKVLFRILFIIFFTIGLLNDNGLFGIAIIAYLCLWIAMPAARSVEQKCEMKGKPMNIEGYRSKDFDFEKEVREAVSSPAGKTIRRVGMVFLGLVLLIAGCGSLIGCIFIPSIPELIGSHTINLSAVFEGADIEEIYGISGIFMEQTFWYLVLVMLGVLSVWMVYNGVILTFDLKSPSWKPGLVLFVAWIISLLTISGWLIHEIAVMIPSII